jgi:hypothetical protein
MEVEKGSFGVEGFQVHDDRRSAGWSGYRIQRDGAENDSPARGDVVPYKENCPRGLGLIGHRLIEHCLPFFSTHGVRH